MADNVMDLASYQQWAEAQQQANNAWSAEQAQKQMDFQERMSSTAHKREVEDLKAAGLNPVLSSGGAGASSPAGSAAQADTSTASNVGGILQQVLANQSAQAVAGMYTAASTYAAQLQAETAREYTNPLGIIMTILGGLFGEDGADSKLPGKKSAASSAAGLLQDAVQLIFNEGSSSSSKSGTSGTIIDTVKKVLSGKQDLYSRSGAQSKYKSAFAYDTRSKAVKSVESGLFNAWFKSMERQFDLSGLSTARKIELSTIFSKYGSAQALKWLRSKGFARNGIKN